MYIVWGKKVRFVVSRDGGCMVVIVGKEVGEYDGFCRSVGVGGCDVV